MAKSVMVDIETLSTQSDACVISVGFAEFDGKNVIAIEGLALHTDYWTGHIDPRTVKWWSEQAAEARDYSFNGKATPAQVVDLMVRYMKDADEVWANSPQFDIVILENWWKRVMAPGNKFPMSYKAPRDCRTVFNESRRLGIELGNAWVGTSVAHNPIDDAANQARAIIEWRRHFPGVSI
jgi:hypothetical protein